MPVRTLIVDDERLMRRDLRTLLEAHDDVTVIGEANSVESARRSIEELQPDVIFLDVQMPPASGFDLLDAIDTDAVSIVFVTAYDRYAVRAFEVNSLDFLLKPVQPERLATTLERVRRKLETIDILKPLQESTKLAYTDTIFVRLGRYGRFIPLQSIRYIRPAEKYTELVGEAEKMYLSSQTLQEWEERLPEEFIRIHRSCIINSQHIVRTTDNPNGSKYVYLLGIAKPLAMSRRYASSWRKNFPSI
jgi:two-component system LytT family response regulator